MSNSFTFKGILYKTDDNGFLLTQGQELHPNWSRKLGEHLAKQEKIEMTESHWEVIIFLREYYEEYKIAPMIMILVKAIGKKLGKEKGNTKYLYDLYPGGPAKQACKIAGLPNPTLSCWL